MQRIDEGLSTILPSEYLSQLQDGLVMRVSKSAMVDLRQAVDPSAVPKARYHDTYVLRNPEWLISSRIEKYNEPYSHTIINPVFDAAVADDLLSFLENIK